VICWVPANSLTLQLTLTSQILVTLHEDCELVYKFTLENSILRFVNDVDDIDDYELEKSYELKIEISILLYKSMISYKRERLHRIFTTSGMVDEQYTRKSF
jgi:hypothetical protein